MLTPNLQNNEKVEEGGRENLNENQTKEINEQGNGNLNKSNFSLSVKSLIRLREVYVINNLKKQSEIKVIDIYHLNYDYTQFGKCLKEHTRVT